MRPHRLAIAGLCGLVLTALTGAARQTALPPPAGAFTAIQSPAAEGSAEPNLVSDGKGRVWLSWLEPNPAGGQRFRLSSLAGATWSPPVTIAEGPSVLANWADFPSIFVTSDGTLAAHWLERGPARSAYGVRVSTSRDSGKTWSKPFIPHRDSATGEHGFVSFFESPGGFGLVWLDGRDAAGEGRAAGGHGGAMAIRAAIVKNGVPGPDVVVDSRVCDCCQTATAKTRDAVLVAYRDRSQTEIRDMSVVRLSDGRWSEPVTIHDDHWELTGCPVNGPAIAAIDNTAAVAWFTAAGNSPRTMVSFSTDGGRTFGSPIRIDIGPTLGRLAIVMPSIDRALVSSLERAGSGAHLVLREVRRDGRTSAPVEIAEATPDRSGGFARLARSGSKLVAAWTEVRAGAPPVVRTAVALVK
jgi:hypothetical protein